MMDALAVYPEKKLIQIIQHPDPGQPGSGQARVKVLDVGVCGTDKEIASFHYGNAPEGEPYLVPGHECLGQVEEVGDGVDELSVGDLVVPVVRLPCCDATCLPCRSGEQDFCRTGGFTEHGIKHAHGFMTEAFVADVSRLHKAPATLRDYAVLTEPLSIAEKSLLQIKDVQDRLPWDVPSKLNAVVLGAGPVGLLGAMAFRLQGYNTVVYSLEPSDDPKAQIVRDIGGSYMSAREHDLDTLNRIVDPMDVVYEAAGAPTVAFKLLNHLDHNGIFVFTGVPGSKPASELDLSILMRNMVLKNQALFGTVNAGSKAYANALKDLAAIQTTWPGVLDRLITGRYPLAKAQFLLSAEASGIKNIVTFQEQSR